MSASYLVTQGYQIVNDAYNDVMGKTNGLNDLETTDFVSMGQALDDFDLLDKWYGALTNRIIRTVVFARSYSADTRNILRDENTFGAFVRKIYVSAPDAVENPAFTNAPSSNQRTQNSPYDVKTTLSADEFVFGGETTWSYEFQMPTIQIYKAWTSESEMMAFVDGQFTAVNNKIELAKESLVNSAINTSVANSIYGGKVRNLLTEYNATQATPLTRAEALVNKDFLIWASKEINKAVKFIQKPSVNWNVLGYETYTPLNKLTVEVLTDFADACKFFSESTIYNAELVKLPMYKEIEFWQSQGKNQSFNDCSAIDIINDGIVNGGEFKIDGIVAVLRDDDAVACYFGNEYQWSMPNPRDRVSIHGYQYKKGYAVDSHINEFVFIIADDTNVTLTKGTGVSDIKLVGNVGQIEIVPTATSGKTISAVQYKYTGDASYTTITATADGKYLMDRLVNTVPLEIKVTAS